MPGTIEVPTHALEPIDDVPGSLGPSLREADIVSALGRAYQDWHQVKADALAHAAATGQMWSWKHQTGAFVRWLNPS
jgi:hypothetical protein